MILRNDTGECFVVPGFIECRNAIATPQAKDVSKIFQSENSSGLSRTTDIIGREDAGTIAAVFDERIRRTPKKIAYRQYEPAENCWRSYNWQDMAKRVARWRKGFAGSRLVSGQRVSILLKNSVEWVCFDQAALRLGLVTVPLHATDGPENWADQLADAEPRLLLVGRLEDWRVLAPLRHRFPLLEQIVCLEATEDNSLGIVHIDAWLDNDSNPTDVAIESGTLATITYTSGTTGRPKGVMLSHRNIISAADATLQRNPVFQDDVFLSFLPMAHIFERTTEYYLAIAGGGQMAFARSISNLPEDLTVIKPSVIMGVPRIFERVWKSVVVSASKNPIGRWLLGRVTSIARNTGKNTIFAGIERWLIRLFITRNLLQRFGGHLRIAISGGAPMSDELARSLRAIGLPLVEGYGLAEAAGPVSGDSLADYEPGAVGRPLDGTEVRIADSGEILLKSASVMQGYWKRPEQTVEVLDRQGWLHTGDKGELRQGRLYVHGRMRDLITLSTGEKLAPSDLESRIITDPLFEQAMVLGDRRPVVAALVVLNRQRWRDFAADKGLDPEDPNNRRCERAMLQRIAGLCHNFPEYAQIRHLRSGFDIWTAEAGLLSVTMKVKRDAVSAALADEIGELFAGHE